MKPDKERITATTANSLTRHCVSPVEGLWTGIDTGTSFLPVFE